MIVEIKFDSVRFSSTAIARNSSMVESSNRTFCVIIFFGGRAGDMTANVLKAGKSGDKIKAVN